jgi:tryptophan-rich sensory protein
MNTIYAYLISVVCVASVSFAGSVFTNKNVNTKWYECIKPSITPPRIVFPIVWTVLYVLLALAFARTLSSETLFSDMILVYAFVLNLIFNVLWCFMFFEKKDLMSALVVILSLLMTIGIIITRCDDLIVFYCMIPYLIWILFASFLNMMALLNTFKCAGKMQVVN